jgi:hypothetical protein
VPILAAILALVLFAASRTVTKDVARLQAWMRGADREGAGVAPVKAAKIR